MLAFISNFVYYHYIETLQGEAVKQSEFVKWLKDQEAVIKNGKKHLKVYLNGKQTTVPRHPGKEISNQFVEVIKKQLNIK